MNALRSIAAFALVCAGLSGYSQACAGHASAKGGSTYDMAAVSKELSLTAEQQTAFTNALAACDKDCTAMASNGAIDANAVAEKKTNRFHEAITSMKGVLKADQYTKLEEMYTAGKLSGLCSTGSGCAGAKAKGGCCAGKAGAHAEPARTTKAADASATPTIQ